MSKSIYCFFLLLLLPSATVVSLKEYIIGYEIDQMIKASDSSKYYDTVAIIYKKGDSIYTKATNAYEFKTLKNNDL